MSDGSHKHHKDVKPSTDGMSGWIQCELGEIADVQTGPFGSQLKNGQYITGGTPVVTVEHIENFRINDFSYPSVTEEDKERLSKYLLEEGDIIFTRVGSVDLSAYVKPHQKGWMFSSRMLRVRPENIIDSRFLSYYFQQKSFRDYVLCIAVGATMPSINTSILRSLPVAYPPLKEQKAIASVLSSLDDKIDLLHRQNKTLEATAETLFRQWFVEEAGDWEIRKIGDFVNINHETAGKDYVEKVIEYLDTSSLTEGVIQDLQMLSFKEAPSRARRLVKHNDVLISTVRPNQKHYGIIKNPKSNLVVSTGFCVLSCYGIDPHFIYLLLTSDQMTEFLHSIAEGSTSTYPSLKPSDIEKIEFHLPPKDKLDTFSVMASKSWDKIEKNHLQIKTLKKLRDSLLPKLMSGEVRVAL